MKVKVCPKRMWAIAHAVSTEETRYYLRGIHVKSAPGGGVALAATNGHWMMVAHDPEGETDGEYIIGLDKPKLPFKKTDLFKYDAAAISWDGNVMTFGAGEGFVISAHAARHVDGTFPDIGRIIADAVKNAGEVGERQFNAAYVEQTAAIARQFDTDVRTPLGTSAIARPIVVSKEYGIMAVIAAMNGADAASDATVMHDICASIGIDTK